MLFSSSKQLWLLLYVNAAYAALNLAVVRPFSSHDYTKLGDSFNIWNTHIPCNINASSNRYDLVLSYSQDLGTGDGKRVVSPFVDYIVDLVRHHRQPWTHCFQNIYIHNSNIRPADDIYKPSWYGKNILWVNGPNRQFLALTHYFERANRYRQPDQAYDAWYLMEIDSTPRRAGFLDALANEIQLERPFAILGSNYRGDRWDMFMNEIHPFLKNHVNGNAVYNNSHPMMQVLTKQLELESNTYYKSVPYDYRISQIIHENIFIHEIEAYNREYYDSEKVNGNSFYKGSSRVIGNYAATNMINELYHDEYIIHGARNYESWNGSATPIALVVTDWGNGELDAFHQGVINGTHPFSEVVYVVPEHRLPASTDFYVRGRDRLIYISFRTRNARGKTQNDDYIDICFHQPLTTKYFMHTNTHMRLSSPVHLMVDRDGKPLLNYVDYRSDTCQSVEECVETVREARQLTGIDTNYMVQDMSMIFDRELTGNMTGNHSGYCQFWWNTYYSRHSNFRHKRCIPKYGPTATGYLAYLKRQRVNDVYHFSNAVTHGTRDTVVPTHVMTTDDSEERYCGSVSRSRKAHATSSSLVATAAGKRRNAFPKSLINCVNIIDDPERCNSMPYCWYRPVFNKCIQIHQTTDTYEQQYYSKPRQESSVLTRYTNRGSGDDDCMLNEGSAIAAIVTLGTLVLVLLIPLAVLLAIGVLACMRRSTVTGVPRVVSTLEATDVVAPSIAPFFPPEMPPPVGLAGLPPVPPGPPPSSGIPGGIPPPPPGAPPSGSMRNELVNVVSARGGILSAQNNLLLTPRPFSVAPGALQPP